MKKIVSVIILSVILIHLVGFYVYFVVRQAQIRQEMREMIGQLPDEHFEVFTFTQEEYLLVRVNDHEVKIDGKMYDHSAPKFKKGKVILYARHDEAEDNLIGFLNEVVNNTSKDQKPVPTQLLTFFSLTFISPPSLAIDPVFKFENLFGFYSAILLNQNYPVESPPPKG